MSASRGLAFAGTCGSWPTGGSAAAPRGIFPSMINTATVCSSKTTHFIK